MPRTLGMFPLSTVLFPGALLPLHVFEPRYQEMMADCLAGEQEFGVVLITRGSEVGGGDTRETTGTVARITGTAGMEDGRMMVVAQGTHRVRVAEWLPDDPYPRAVVDDLPDAPGDPGAPGGPGADRPVAAGAAEASVRRLCFLLSELGDVPAPPLHLDLGEADGDGDGDGDADAGWQLCALAPLNLIDQQRLLACPDPVTRMALLTDLCTDMAADVTALLAGGMDG